MNLKIECGDAAFYEIINSQKNYSDFQGIVDFMKEIDINISLLAYDSVLEGKLNDGRPPVGDIKFVINEIIFPLNYAGFSFALAINGGIGYKKISLDKIESYTPVLEVLSDMNKTFGLTNSVIITHDDVLEYVKKNNPDLKTIASCFRRLDPFSKGGYERDFHNFDEVVIWNSHTTSDFLKRYSIYSDQMIIFYNLGCASDNMFRCYMHRINKQKSIYPQANIEHLTEENFFCKGKHIIGSQLPLEKTALIKNVYQPDYIHKSCIRGYLYERPNDTIKLFEMGINKIKFPRDYIIDKKLFFRLISSFLYSKR